MPKQLKKVIYYGVDSQQFGHLYKPEGANAVPVVIVIHGGYWKDNHDLDSYPTSAIVNYLQEFSLAVWNLEYRRMDSVGENTQAPWPAVFEDIANGIDHLEKIKAQEGLDLKRTLVIGHSAGGLLATWAGSRRQIAVNSELYRNQPLQIQQVISIAGILNLFAADDVDQPMQITRLMGGDKTTHPTRYAACDPSTLHKPNIDLTLIHGAQDSCVKVSQAQNYCDLAQGRVKKVIMAEADHFSMLPHEGPWVDSQWQQLKQLITLAIAKMSKALSTDNYQINDKY